jgi:hypothetical protein
MTVCKTKKIEKFIISFVKFRNMDKQTGSLEKRWWVEPWYLSDAILGCTMGGMFPILMPILVLKRFSSACPVGHVMAAFNLGGLMAPIWGSIADRYCPPELIERADLVTKMQEIKHYYQNGVLAGKGIESYGVQIPAKSEFRKVYGQVLETADKKIIPLQHPAAILHDSSIKNVMVTNYRKMEVFYRRQVAKDDCAQEMA